MKPPRNPQGQCSQTIPELIQHLKGLYSGMVADPALAETAKHIHAAVTELETARRVAVEVYQECLAANARTRSQRPAKADDAQGDDAAEWLRNLQPASPLKQ
jgi:hypothetical protein